MYIYFYTRIMGQIVVNDFQQMNIPTCSSVAYCRWSDGRRDLWCSDGCIWFDFPRKVCYSVQTHTFADSRLFPTCQVRVVRFYQSCCPPPPPPPPPVSPRPCLHQLPPPLPPCQLFAKLFANFRAQCALLDLNLGPSQLSAHRWTSTWDLPSSVRTAGPQPGTFPAQCAPLNLNLGPSQLSAHRWTSTWDLPSSVRTAEPQRPDRMPEDMPDGMSDRIPKDMPDKMP